MQIKGKLIYKSEEQHISQTFTKREFVIEYAENPQYPELIKLDLANDKCKLIDNMKIGQEIEVHFNLKGKKFNKNGNDQYFNSLQCWKIV